MLPESRAFRLGHLIGWLFYLAVVALNLKLLWDVRQGGALELLPAVVLSLVALGCAAAWREPWLDGARRSTLFRIALLPTCGASLVLAAWMLWYYGVFFFIGVITFFQRPFELISLTLFLERFGIMALGLGGFALYAAMSVRTAWDLATLQGDPLPLPAPPPPPAPARRAPVPRPAARRPLPPQEIVGKHRYLHPPRELASGEWPSSGFGFRGGYATDRVRRVRELGWPAFEWIFRTVLDPKRLTWTLQALPYLAATVDEDDAAEARDWISRLADHPGTWDEPIHSHDPDYGYASIRTCRVADAALPVLEDWDRERAARR